MCGQYKPPFDLCDCWIFRGYEITEKRKQKNEKINFRSHRFGFNPDSRVRSGPKVSTLSAGKYSLYDTSRTSRNAERFF